MTIWIEALLDNQPVSPSDRKRGIQPPPPFYKDGVVPPPVTASDFAPPPLLATANTSARRRSTRSASPAKRVQSPRKVRLAKTSASTKEHPLKSEPLVLNGLRSKSEEEEEGAVATTTVTTTEETVATTETTVQEIAAKKEPTVKVEIDNVHQTTGDVEVEKTRVKVEYPHDEAEFLPIPENTEDMMAKAMAMVEESRRLEGDLPTKKRKAEEDESTGSDSIQAPKVKRSRVLERQLREEKVKTKALIGLSLGLTLA